MYFYTYISLLCLLYIQNTYAYFAYYMQNRSVTSKHIIDDYVPKWNKICFTQDRYKDVLCSVTNMPDSCILYVNCVSNFCSANFIQLFQHYAKHNNLSGVIFYGNPAFEGECIMPSTFIQQDLSSYVNHNIVVEFGYKTTKSTFLISEITLFVLVSFFVIGFIFKLSKNSQTNSNIWTWHRSPLASNNSQTNLRNMLTWHRSPLSDSFNSINSSDDNHENPNEGEDNNSQIRILVNTKYVASDSEPPTCAICLDVFENGDTISKLSCEHKFKHECINKWLKMNTRCPLCNSQE